MKELPFCGMHTNTHTHTHSHTHLQSFTHIDIHVHTATQSHTFTHHYTHPFAQLQSHTHSFIHSHTVTSIQHTHTCCEGWGRHPARTPGPAPSADLGCCQDLLLVQLRSWFPRVSLNSCLVQPFQVEHSTPVGPSPRLSGHSIRWQAVQQSQKERKEGTESDS